MVRKVMVAWAVLALMGCPSDEPDGDAEDSAPQAGMGGGGSGTTGGAMRMYECIDVPRSALEGFSPEAIAFKDCTTRSLRNYGFCETALPVQNGMAESLQIVLQYDNDFGTLTVIGRENASPAQRHDVRISGHEHTGVTEEETMRYSLAVTNCARASFGP